MNTILQNLKAGQTLDFGTFTIYTMDDGGCMVARMNSSLIGPTVGVNKGGLKQLLDWVDAETEHAAKN
jgi:hypothetical protein